MISIVVGGSGGGGVLVVIARALMRMRIRNATSTTTKIEGNVEKIEEENEDKAGEKHRNGTKYPQEERKGEVESTQTQ